MARATTTKSSAKPSARTSRLKVTEEAPKRKPGRPAGSTNAKKSAPPARVSKTAAKRAPAAKAAAAAPKMNKADLEAHVAKLERTLSRLREKNKELKQVATEAREHSDLLQEQLSAKPAAAATKTSRKTRRSATQQTPAPDADEAETESADS